MFKDLDKELKKFQPKNTWDRIATASEFGAVDHPKRIYFKQPEVKYARK